MNPKGPLKPLRVRFDEKWTPEPNTGCWLWTAGVNRFGYAMFRIPRLKITRGNRAAWTIYRGTIPAGLLVDHICRVRSCVNPDHLRLVTAQQNTTQNSVSLVAVNATKTHCINGHSLSGDNLAMRLRRGRNVRRCRACKREDDRKYARKSARKSVASAS